jgi:alpha-glucosidase
VNVAYTRALAGPVDYHLGGFRSVSRAEFRPRDRAPVVMGTRCHNVALYVVYENPMPMVADAPEAYEGQPGFDFLCDVPTTWNETCYVAGEPGEYIVLARRHGDRWHLGGITNWTPRTVSVPLAFLAPGEHQAHVYADGSMDESSPDSIRESRQTASATTPLTIDMAAGGGFVAVIDGP